MNKTERTMISLIILLFFIALIESYRLVAITGAFIMIYSFKGCKAKAIFKMIKSALPFVVLLILPSIIRYILSRTTEDIEFTMFVISKILLSSILLGSVVHKHSAMCLVEGISKIGLPSLINRILVLTFRYFYMIYEDVQKGKMALHCRGIKERKGFASLSIFGEWIGGFFLKSSIHSDMVFNAMQSRGFQGESGNKNNKNKRLIIEACLMSLFLIAVLIVDGKV